MEFSIKHSQADRVRTACAIVGIYEGGKLSPSAKSIDRAAAGYLAQLHNRGDIKTRIGACTLLHAVPDVAAERVMLVGLGKQGALGLKGFRDSVAAAVKALAATGAREATLYSTEWDANSTSSADRVLHAVSVAADTNYRFDRMKSQKDDNVQTLAHLTLGTTVKPSAAEASAADAGSCLAEGVAFAKDLGNLPSNVCTPSYLASQALHLAKSHKLKVTVLERKDLEKLGMGSFLSVAKGSTEPPKFIVMEHRGGPKKQKPVVLVGKGITFDTGGISIKPSGDMDEMKYDMSGAGSVLGTMKAVAGMRLPINVVGLVPTCENMPSGTAIKPGDIVTSMSGQTIEVLNTDAEGRLILCDALTYAERFEPAAVIDIATLTGACVIALGHVATGLFANKDELARELVEAGSASWDRAWPMPLWDDYQEQIKSPFADMANIGGRPAGSITAACFLARFAKKYPWAHLDIAGTAWRSGRDKGSTGRPVPMLTAFLVRRAAK
ncbi:MAG: leucyl aminopeptidase [Betaproteobacteria bacterium]